VNQIGRVHANRSLIDSVDESCTYVCNLSEMWQEPTAEYNARIFHVFDAICWTIEQALQGCER